MKNLLIKTPLFGRLYILDRFNYDGMFLCQNDMNKKFICCDIGYEDNDKVWLIGLIDDEDYANLLGRKISVQGVLYKKECFELFSFREDAVKGPVMVLDGIRLIYYLPEEQIYVA